MGSVMGSIIRSVVGSVMGSVLGSVLIPGTDQSASVDQLNWKGSGNFFSSKFRAREALESSLEFSSEFFFLSV